MAAPAFLFRCGRLYPRKHSPTERLANGRVPAQETAMSEETVLYSTHGAVALITLNRPQALNSFTRQMHGALWAALDRIEADKAIRACVITGAGRGFCAGADLAEFDFEPGPGLVERADP